MPLTLLCERCGGPLPPLSEEEQRLVTSGRARVELRHDVCPGSQEEAARAAPPPGRVFEVRCQVVEVFAGPRGEAAQEPPEVLLSMSPGVRAEDLQSAMRPLADALGVVWQQVEERAALADPRSAANLAAPS